MVLTFFGHHVLPNKRSFDLKDQVYQGIIIKIHLVCTWIDAYTKKTHPCGRSSFVSGLGTDSSGLCNLRVVRVGRYVTYHVYTGLAP